MLPPFNVVAKYDFVAEESDELSFSVGDNITVIAEDGIYKDGWWTGEIEVNNSIQRGLFHKDYVVIEDVLTKPLPQVPESIMSTNTSSSARNSSQIFISNPESWSESDVKDWLKSKGFEHIVSHFSGIDGPALTNVSLAQLREMNIDALSDRINLLHEILLLGECYRYSQASIPSPLTEQRTLSNTNSSNNTLKQHSNDKGDDSSQKSLQNHHSDSGFIDDQGTGSSSHQKKMARLSKAISTFTLSDYFNTLDEFDEYAEMLSPPTSATEEHYLPEFHPQPLGLGSQKYDGHNGNSFSDNPLAINTTTTSNRGDSFNSNEMTLPTPRSISQDGSIIVDNCATPTPRTPTPTTPMPTHLEVKIRDPETTLNSNNGIQTIPQKIEKLKRKITKGGGGSTKSKSGSVDDQTSTSPRPMSPENISPTVTIPSDDSNATFSGVLYTLVPGLKGWKKRWCFIDGDVMYICQSHRGSPCAALVPLQHFKIMPDATPNQSKTQFAFMAVQQTETESITVRFASLEQLGMISWINALVRAGQPPSERKPVGPVRVNTIKNRDNQGPGIREIDLYPGFSKVGQEDYWSPPNSPVNFSAAGGSSSANQQTSSTIREGGKSERKSVLLPPAKYFPV